MTYQAAIMQVTNNKRVILRVHNLDTDDLEQAKLMAECHRLEAKRLYPDVPAMVARIEEK